MPDALVNKPFFRILDSFMSAGEVVRNVWTITPETDVPLDAFLRPETYTHVARKLRKGDHVEVLAADGSWWAELLVRSVDGLDVRVGLLISKEFDPAESLTASDYLVEWAGHVGKGRVIRIGDKRVMVEGLPSKAAAQAWLDERCTPEVEPQKAA